MQTRNCYTCDDVFEILTRAPFGDGVSVWSTSEFSEEIGQESGPQSEETAAVLRHLRACHECRQFADALRPAAECVHEALSAEERIGLPEFRSVVPVVMETLGDSVAASSATADPAKPFGKTAQRALTLLAAAFLLAAGLAALFGDFHGNGSGVPTTFASSPVALLTSMDLPKECGAAPLNQADSLIGKLEDACCSDCHVSEQKASVNPHVRGKVSAACSACHHVNAAKLPPQPARPKVRRAKNTCLACHVAVPQGTLAAIDLPAWQIKLRL